jgi:hypothetical protein
MVHAVQILGRRRMILWPKGIPGRHNVKWSLPEEKKM